MADSKRDSSRQPMAKWLKTVRLFNGLKQDELAAYVGKTRSTIAMYETSVNAIPPEVVASILTNFPDSPKPPGSEETVVTGLAVAEDRIAKIFYAGIVPCSSSWGDPLESQEMRSIEPKFAGRGRFLCRVGGDSCYPALQERDLTVWETDRDPDWGLIVLAQRLDDGACTVKQLLYDSQRSRPILKAVNPDFASPDDGEGWEVVARLVGVIRRGDGPERTWYFEAGIRPEHLLA